MEDAGPEKPDSLLRCGWSAVGPSRSSRAKPTLPPGIQARHCNGWATIRRSANANRIYAVRRNVRRRPPPQGDVALLGLPVARARNDPLDGSSLGVTCRTSKVGRTITDQPVHAPSSTARSAAPMAPLQSRSAAQLAPQGPHAPSIVARSAPSTSPSPSRSATIATAAPGWSRR